MVHSSIINNDFMSFSMFVDSGKTKSSQTKDNAKFWNIHKRKIYTWVNDDEVIKCYNCKCNFNFLCRKHHCRMCGRIFCNTCSDHYAIIDKRYTQLDIEYPKSNYQDYIGKIFGYITDQERVCCTCYIDIERYIKIDEILTFFILCQFTVVNVLKFRLVCRLWYDAVAIYLSDFRNIQYDLPFRGLNEREKILLWNNRNCIAGHSKLIIQLIKSSKLYDVNIKKEVLTIIKSKKHISCTRLMCTRGCNSKIRPYEAMELIDIGCEGIQNYVVSTIKDINTLEMECYIPILLKKISKNHYLFDFILQYCKNHPSIKYKVLWTLHYLFKNDKPEYRHQMLANQLNDDVFQTTKKFFHKFNINNRKSILSMINNMLKSNINKSLLLFNKKTDIKRINKCNILKSSSNPILLSLITSNDKKKGYILKYECLYKDMIVMSLVKLSRYILKKELGDDFNIITYDILPLDKEFGIIEKVMNSQTIYKIKNRFTIQNYILEKNPNIKVHTVKMKFVKSCAAFCIITYILGIGDRHLDNIMIHNNGELFHIDFGYILGDDPKYVNSSMRLTHDMIITLGGEHSKYYEIFKNYCVKIYNCLRRYINIYTIILLNSNLPDIDKNRLKDEIIKRFLPGQTYLEAELQLKSKMKRSEKDYSYTLIDIFHSYRKTNYFSVLYDKYIGKSTLQI